MEIMEIDALSFATRIAVVAAAETCGLLTHGEPKPMPLWYTAATGLKPKQIAADMNALAEFCCSSKVDNPETLWRHMVAQRRVQPAPNTGPEFASQPFAVRQAYGVFALACLSQNKAITGVQASIEVEEAAAKAVTARPPLAIKDSIFEEEEPIDALENELISGQPTNSASQKSATKTDTRQRVPNAKPKGKKPARPKPMSIGAESPVNVTGKPAKTKKAANRPKTK
jgi:hypothetical protein